MTADKRGGIEWCIGYLPLPHFDRASTKSTPIEHEPDDHGKKKRGGMPGGRNEETPPVHPFASNPRPIIR
jgi:hypothetical protein